MAEKDGQKVFVNSFEGPFLNTDFLVVEFDDVIQAAELYVLCGIIKDKSKIISELYNTDVIYSYENFNEIFDWYVNRPEKVVFANLEPTQTTIINALETFNTENDEIKAIKNFSEFLMEQCINANEVVFEAGPNLNFLNTLSVIYNTKIVKNILVFSKYSAPICERISKYLKNEIGLNLDVISCNDFSNFIKENKITNNSTFVFSDMRHINELKENNILRNSSIIIPDWCGYNKNEDGSYIVNIEELLKDDIFKINFFNNYYE